MKLRSVAILLFFAAVFGLLYSFPAASQDVGVIEEELGPEFPQITLKFSGNSCEINLNESELLHVKGVLGVDIESKPGKIVVTYDPARTGVAKLLGAIGKKKGGCVASEDVAGVKTGEDKGK